MFCGACHFTSIKLSAQILTFDTWTPRQKSPPQAPNCEFACYYRPPLQRPEVGASYHNHNSSAIHHTFYSLCPSSPRATTSNHAFFPERELIRRPLSTTCALSPPHGGKGGVRDHHPTLGNTPEVVGVPSRVAKTQTSLVLPFPKEETIPGAATAPRPVPACQ